MSSRSNALFVVGVVLILGLVLYGYSRVMIWEAPVPVASADVAADTDITVVTPPKKSPGYATLGAQSGVVELKVGHSGWMPAESGSQLLPGMALRTGAQSNAKLSYGTDNEISVDLLRNSEVRLDRIDDDVARFVVGEGLVIIDVKPGGDRVVQLVADGSDAVAETRGGRVAMLNDGKGHVQTAVLEGDAVVEAAGKQVKVGAGQATLVTPGSAPHAPTVIPNSLLLKVKWPGAKHATSITGATEIGTGKKRHRITGHTAPGSLVRIGEKVVAADPNGRFSAIVGLVEGRNRIKVEVIDVVGRVEILDSPTINLDTKAPESVIQTDPGMWKKRKK